jgi:O-succinylbenzoate synthase
MKIDQVDLYHIEMRLKAPFKTSFGLEYDREAVLIRIRSNGLEGWGECVASKYPGFSYETTMTAWHVLKDFLVPAVFQAEISQIQDYRRLAAGIRGHNLAKAGFEMAIWDLMGKASGQSLASLLGGDRDRVPVGVSIGLKEDLASLLRIIRGYVESGYRRIKLKIMPMQDVKIVEAVRETFPDLPLQVDANAAYTLEDVAVFQALDAFNLLMVEQPLAEDDLIEHSRLQAMMHTPVCLDESIVGLRHARQAIEIESCRVINIKSARVGGILEAVRIHDHCHEKGVPVWCGGMLETGVGRAGNIALATLPGFQLPGDISASDRYYERDIVQTPFSLNSDSTISVPAGPGLGISIDESALESYTLRSETLKDL